MSRFIPSVHVFHSNVGGIGTTHLAGLLADYFQREGRDLRCFDSDPTGGGLIHYRGLHVQRLWKDGVHGGEMIDFDPVFDSRAEISILDCGPVGYGAFLQYIKDNRLEERADWMLHVPLMEDRLESSRYGLERMMNALRPLSLVFWLHAFTPRPCTLEEALSGLPVAGDAIAGSINLTARELVFPLYALGPICAA